MVQIGSKTRFFVILSFFGSLLFLEIAYDDSLEHCLATNRDKTIKKIFWGLKLGLKLVFLPFSQGCIASFP